MSGMDAYLRSVAAAMGDELGSETVELRRPTTLRDAGLQALEDLVAHAPAVAGDALLTVVAADGRPFKGGVPARLLVTVPGGAVTTSAAVDVPLQATTLALPVTALPVDVAAGAPVALAVYASHRVPHCTVHTSQDSLVDKMELAGAPSFAVSIPCATSPVAPAVGDVIVSSLGGGVVFASPGDGGGSYEVLVSRQAGSSVIGWGVS